MQIILYAHVDMQTDSVSTRLKSGYWPRGRDIVITDQSVECGLRLEAQYKLAESVRYSPHLRFLGCQTKEEFADFIRAWGPLRIVPGAPALELQRRMSSLPFPEYLVFQRWLSSVVRLIVSCEREGDFETVRRAFIEFASSESLYWRRRWNDGPSALNTLLQGNYCPENDLFDFIAKSPERVVRAMVSLALEVILSEQISVKVRDIGHRFEIVPDWDLNDLESALVWMVWQDRVGLCAECGQVFKVTARRWKYHSDECAKRATDRAWRREKRKADMTRTNKKRSGKVRHD